MPAHAGGHTTITVGLVMSDLDIEVTRAQAERVAWFRMRAYSVHIVTVTQEGILLLILKAKLSRTHLPLRVLPDGTYHHAGHETSWKFHHRRTLWPNIK